MFIGNPTSGLTPSGKINVRQNERNFMVRIPGKLTRRTAAPPKPQLDLDVVLDCTYLHYPWDDWERYARACGLDAGLAGQARLLIREAFNHDWPHWLKPVCGWSDDGQALLAFALRDPKAARRQWDILFRTDGLRGDYPNPRSIEWVYGFLRPDAQRLLSALSCQRL
jgi:hypothetical protein